MFWHKMQIWEKKWSLNYKILRQKSGLWSLKTGGLLMQVKIIVITLGRIIDVDRKLSGNMFIQVIYRFVSMIAIEKNHEIW